MADEIEHSEIAGPSPVRFSKIVTAEDIIDAGTEPSDLRSMKELMHGEMSMSFWRKFMGSRKKQQELAVIDFVIERLKEYLSNLSRVKCEHEVLGAFHRLCTELERIDGMSFDALSPLESQFYTLTDMQPFPTKEVFDAFFISLGKLRNDEVIKGMTLNEHGLKQYEEAQLNNFASLDKEVKDFAIDGIKIVQKAFQRFPLLFWFTDILITSVTDHVSLVVFTYNWEGTVTYHKPNRTRCRWTALGEALAAGIATDCLREADVRTATLPGVEELQGEVLPVLILELTHLRAVMQKHIEEADDIQQKLLALFVTVGVSGGQVVMRHFFGHSSCCE
eukprot:TRINITY_DN9773_c0_g1_i2.p1 TRINITY_DN9773_c0_g1~~TRINITY_DN9773_c0_g1_i2.p1  ORF type:complete len:385 (+),score=74.47 TRINITY_DN9773_c0_g1_i2:156-1157(+)